MNVLFFVLTDFLKIQEDVGEKGIEWEATGWQRSTGKLNLSEWGKNSFLYHNLVGLRDIFELSKAAGKTFTHLIFLTLIFALCLLPSKYYLVWKALFFPHIHIYLICSCNRESW